MSTQIVNNCRVTAYSEERIDAGGKDYKCLHRSRLARRVQRNMASGGIPELGVGAGKGVMVESGVRVRQGFEGGGGLAENVACLE
jgi:hypothetical protein